MSIVYAEGKIKEALALAKGNKTKANQIVMAMAMQDVKLLQGLTKHHLAGIVAYHVERVLSGRTSQPQGVSVAPTQQNVKPKTVVRASDPFGAEILRAVGGGGEVFGFDAGSAPSSKPASQRHVNAIKQMVARSKSLK